jgi:hypothetical protein
MSFTEIGCLFKCVRELQDAEILFITANNLQADGKPFGRIAGRHRGRRFPVAEMYEQDFIQSM